MQKDDIKFLQQIWRLYRGLRAMQANQKLQDIKGNLAALCELKDFSVIRGNRAALGE